MSGFYQSTNDPRFVFSADHVGPELDCFRPVVVIDPEDREQVERLTVLCIAHDDTTENEVSDMQAALREFADPKPPKPEEPTGLGAVVEDAEGVRWLLMPPSLGVCRWCSWDDDAYRTDRAYADIEAVRVIHQGVQA